MICKEDYEKTKSAIDVIAKGKGDRYSLTRFQSLTCAARFGFDGCSYQKNAQRLLDILEYAEHKNDDRLMPKGMTWPHFEDGEPFKFGDEVSLNNRCGKVNSVKFYSNGNRSIKAVDEDGNWGFVLIGKGEFIKRPEPKQDTLQNVIRSIIYELSIKDHCEDDAGFLWKIIERLKALEERMGG